MGADECDVDLPGRRPDREQRRIGNRDHADERREHEQQAGEDERVRHRRAPRREAMLPSPVRAPVRRSTRPVRSRSRAARIANPLSGCRAATAGSPRAGPRTRTGARTARAAGRHADDQPPQTAHEREDQHHERQPPEQVAELAMGDERPRVVEHPEPGEEDLEEQAGDERRDDGERASGEGSNHGCASARARSGVLRARRTARRRSARHRRRRSGRCPCHRCRGRARPTPRTGGSSVSLRNVNEPGRPTTRRGSPRRSTWAVVRSGRPSSLGLREDLGERDRDPLARSRRRAGCRWRTG